MIDAVQTALREPATMNAATFVAGALAGIPISWIAKWANKEVDCIMDMLVTEPRRTVFSMLANLALVVGAISTGTVPDKAVTAFAAGLLICGFADSVLNKGKRRKWSAKKREDEK